MTDEKFIKNIAIEFFVSALADDSDRAHELSHVILDGGPEFSHDFDASIFFLISAFNDFITEKYPGSNAVIKKLCKQLKYGKPIEKSNKCGCSGGATKKKKESNRSETDGFYLPDFDGSDKFGQ